MHYSSRFTLWKFRWDLNIRPTNISAVWVSLIFWTLKEHCTGIAEVMGLNPIQAWIFFRLSFRNCFSCVYNCNDHSLIPSFFRSTNFHIFTMYVAKQDLDKLQRIQNTAVHLITGTKRYKHIKSALWKLHWLPVESRIIFKVLLIIFKIIHGLCPAYLSSLLQLYQLQRSLRSSSKLLFTVPTVNSASYGERAFSFSAPILWNNLPDPIKNTISLSSFKSALKTFLLRKFYFWFISCGTVPSFQVT